MLQSILPDKLDFDRLVAALSSKSPPSSKLQDTADADGGSCKSNGHLRIAAADAGAATASSTADLQLIVRHAKCRFPCDLILLSQHYHEEANCEISISTAHILLMEMERYCSDAELLFKHWSEACYSGCDASSESRDRSRLVNGQCNGLDFSNELLAGSVFDFDPKQRYIICKTPNRLQQQQQQFWQMVWHSNANAIVNLNSDQLGCDSDNESVFWPNFIQSYDGECCSITFDDIQIHLVSEHACCSDFVIRNLLLIRTADKSSRSRGSKSQSRTVTMFHFVAWQQNSQPGDTDSLRQFRRKVKKVQIRNNEPVIVQCSDGFGRCGAYCLLDVTLKRMSRGVRQLDIAGTLRHLREQRPGLVESFDQFQFVVAAVADEISSMLDPRFSAQNSLSSED